jgi:hypothetical protein
VPSAIGTTIIVIDGHIHVREYGDIWYTLMQMDRYFHGAA